MKAEQQILQHHHNDKHLIKRLLHACIQESLLPFAVKDNALSIPLIRSQKTIVVENVQCYALRKFKLKGEVNLTGKNDQQALENMPQLLNLIHQELESIIDIKKWKQFITEINNCIANDSLVSTSLRAATNQLLENIKKSKHQRLIEYISTHYSTEKQLQFFETWAVNGHPYHPCHKTKLGFNKEAYLKFSPEFNEDIHLPIGAIAKSLMHVESEENDFIYTEWFAQNFPTQWQQWIQAMLEHKLNEAYYYPIFIHPWQYENVLKKLFSDHVHTKKIILFSNITLTTKASLSFRTLISQENPQQPHIKLPVAVQSTSALRTVSPASVQNGPRLGKILRQILLAENHFNHTLKFSYELYGLHINEKTDIAKNLSVIYRQNPATLVQEKQLPMVVAALFVESPVSKLPIFIELIQAATDNSLAAVQAYFDEYSKIVINAFLDLKY